MRRMPALGQYCDLGLIVELCSSSFWRPKACCQLGELLYCACVSSGPLFGSFSGHLEFILELGQLERKQLISFQGMEEMNGTKIKAGETQRIYTE